jgi:hypothetical protein
LCVCVGGGERVGIGVGGNEAVFRAGAPDCDRGIVWNFNTRFRTERSIKGYPETVTDMRNISP